MKIEWTQLGEKLVAASSKCVNETVLAAPFMKAQTLKRVVECLSPSTSLLCLTRWRLEEIDCGVSDLDCWDVVSERNKSRLMLRSNLHTKYFRFDDVAYLGSANLTMTALGWSVRPNAEALIQFRVGDSESIASFEKSLLDGAIDVTPDLVAEFKLMLERFSSAKPNVQAISDQNIVASNERSLVAAASWFPRSRSPEYLYKVYRGSLDIMSQVGLAAAQEDLLDLELPSSLQEPAFVSLVGSRLASTPIVARLDRFLTVRRRFGEIRSWLGTQLNLDDATDDWQRLMRWLLFFLPNRYEAFTANYSEIFGKRVAR